MIRQTGISGQLSLSKLQCEKRAPPGIAQDQTRPSGPHIGKGLWRGNPHRRALVDDRNTLPCRNSDPRSIITARACPDQDELDQTLPREAQGLLQGLQKKFRGPPVELKFC
jgi:hypothetical protein